MSNKFFCCLLLFSLSLCAKSLGQNVYRGKVFDAVHQSPIVGALIQVNDSVTQVTDQEGLFMLNFVNAGDRLVVSHLSYATTELVLDAKGTQLNISLQPRITTLNEIVIQSFNRQKQWISEAAAVGILSQVDFQRNNDLSISNYLNQVPGVYMHSGALNTNRITIRGIGSRSLFSTNKIKAYLNGIPLTTGDGETTVEDIDLRLVDRVEVVKGPNASSYGAGLGGALLYTTAKSKYRSSGVQMDFMTGSFGLNRASIKLNHSDDGKNISLVANNTQSDGYRDNNSYERKSVAIIADFYTNDNNSLHFFGNFVKLKAFIPSSLDLETFENNPTAAAFTWQQSRGFEDYDKYLFGLAYLHNFSPFWQLNTGVFSTGQDTYELRPFNILKDNNNGLGVRTVLSGKNTIFDRFMHMTFGLEFYNDWYNWQTFENANRNIGVILSSQQERRNYLNLFASVDYELGKKSSITLGVNLNRTTYALSDFQITSGSDQSGEYKFKTTLSPRVAYLYRLNESVAVYANISHGFSPPTLAETLTPDGQVNTDIQPESGYNFELGTKGTLGNEKLLFDLSIYQMFIKNLLVARRVGDDQFIGVNAGKTTHKGIELSTRYSVLNNINFKVDVFSNIALTDYEFEEFIDGDNNFDGNQLTGNPSKIINAGIDINLKEHIYTHIQFQYVDEIPVSDSNEIFSDAYSLINIKLGFKQVIKQKLMLDVSAGINNLVDEEYASMILINARGFGGNAPRYYYPGLPRNYYSQIKIAYNFN